MGALSKGGTVPAYIGSTDIKVADVDSEREERDAENKALQTFWISLSETNICCVKCPHVPEYSPDFTVFVNNMLLKLFVDA